jgi:hypothetical protein
MHIVANELITNESAGQCLRSIQYPSNRKKMLMMHSEFQNPN